MTRKIIGTGWDRDNRNAINDNFKKLFDEYTAAGLDAKEAKEKAHDAVMKSDEAMNLSERTQKELSQAILEGDSSPLGGQLSVGADGTVHNNPQERLVKEFNSVNQQLAQKMNQVDANLKYEQIDFVELLKRYNQFNKMQIYKVAQPNSIEVSVLNDDRHITFHFFGTSNDDYSVLNFVYTGTFEKVVQAYLRKEYDELNRTGAWINSTESISGYTHEVGATWEVQVNVENDGSSIAFTTNANDRGGMWKVTLDGVEDTAVEVSTYASPSTKRTTVIAEGVSKGIHTIKGEFLGDDPNNPPSTSPSRGWLNSLGNPVIEVGDQFGKISKDVRLNPVSNKDFAYFFKPKGSTSNNEFVPQHSGVRTSYLASPILYKDGDKELDIYDMPQNSYLSVNSFCVTQHIFARHPDDTEKNLLEIWTNQSITKEGMYQVDGKMKVLEPTTFSNSYVLMGVAESNIFDTILSSFGNKYPNTTDLIGTRTKLPERDWGKSYVFLSSTEKDLAIAYRFNNIRDTLRQGQDGKDAEPLEMTYIQHRDSDVVKIYSRLWNKADVDPGYVHKFSGDYIYSAGQNFYDVMA